MSSITISNLQPAVSSRFSDSDSCLQDLLEIEQQNIQGGLAPIAVAALLMMGAGSIGVGVSLGVLAARAWDKL